MSQTPLYVSLISMIDVWLSKETTTKHTVRHLKFIRSDMLLAFLTFTVWGGKKESAAFFDAVAKLPKVTVSFVMSVRPHRTRLALDGF